MSSTSSHAIKNRTNAKDVFITPKALALMHITTIPSEYTDGIWLDPCANSNNYYDQFPSETKNRCELLEGTNFLEYNEPVDVICSNPPYSILDDWFKHTISLKPKCFSYLIGIGNLTARRIEWCEKAGYGLTTMKMLKVKEWYGMSIIVVFEKDKKSIMTIDRKVWNQDNQLEI
mgnify:FL=1|tara:strand:- start:1373 stop:1894 length:522 start_codon:yes stop_codon:yes gene_type:complete